VNKTRRTAFERVVEQCVGNYGGPATEEGKDLVFVRGQIFHAAGVTTN
jgi:hypothetical protein